MKTSKVISSRWKVLAALFIAHISSAHALILGPYGALGIGQTSIDIPEDNFFNVANIAGGTESRSVGEVSGKIVLGYNIYKYIGVESAYTGYAASRYNASVIQGPNAELKYLMTAISLALKAYLPVGKDNLLLDFYLIGGIAEAFNQVLYTNTGIPLNANSDPNYPLGGTDTNKLRPIYGVGVNYDVTAKISTALEFSRIQGTSGHLGASPRRIPNADLFALVVYYNFTP